jgi:hypothetical protein
LQALFAREDQAGGKRKVGASMLTNLFSSSIRLVGKMRVRLSTITPNAPFNITMPLQGTLPEHDIMRNTCLCCLSPHLQKLSTCTKSLIVCRCSR